MSSCSDIDIAEFFQGATVKMSATVENVFRHTGTAAVVEEGEHAPRVIGRSVKRDRSHLYPGMDRMAAKLDPVPVEIEVDSIMSEREAAERTTGLLRTFGMDSESDGVQQAFLDGMFETMAKTTSSGTRYAGNSGYVLKGRRFDYGREILAHLGDRSRQYYRVYADDTRDLLKKLESDYNAGPRDLSEEGLAAYDNIVQRWHEVLRVADRKGLRRAPHLIADVSDYCTNLTTVERSLIDHSKMVILSTSDASAVNRPIIPRMRDDSGGVVGARAIGGSDVSSIDPNY